MDKKILFLIGILLMYSGCIGQEVQKKLTAEEIRDKSIDAMQNVKSYAFDIDMDIATKREGEVVGIGTGEMNFKISGDGKIDMNQKKMYSKMTVDFLGMKMEMEQYVIGNTQYINIPMFGWVKNETAEDVWSLEYVHMESEIMRNSPVILSGTEMLNDRECYILDINPRTDDILRLISKQYLSTSSTDIEGIKESLKSLKVREWIDKNTFLISRMGIDMETEYENTTMNISITMNFYDYDKPMNIELPEDARNARDMSEIGAMLGTESRL
ncbi:MAG: hypothetical protein DRO94_02215 [Candidatus Altiarchaeales archaeon]|nr:MAG: hypothetical protein DRO94_02215 [Candidatus Altiarchaeales archaeon]HDO81891.1 hypothetical protein [Candidatus Altiarchaeales archaeon]HEX54540.1 hypothetical protein [Candidatus Altiarchaeales archaeon]